MKTNTKVNMKWIIIVTIVLCSTISAYAQFGSGNSVNIKALLIYERLMMDFITNARMSHSTMYMI